MKTILVTILILTTSFIYSQSVNDYRSVGNGNWTTVSSWERYNGTAWVAATTYPGQVAGTNDVTISSGHSITINTTIPNAFNSLTIAGTMVVANTSSFNTSLITIVNGGFGSWTSNVTLFLPEGAAVVIESGGSLDTTKPCSAAKRIQIGSTIYSTCNGGAGADYSFEDLNDGGGTLNVSPSSNSPICVGDTLTLFANPSGAGSDGSGITYAWSAIAGPSGYSYNSTAENPTITGLAASTYTYEVTISDGSINRTDTVDVIVTASPSPPVSGGDQTVCNETPTYTPLTANVNTGETVDWYDASSGGALLLSGNTSYTPTSTGSYFAEARHVSAGCVSTSRTEIVVNTRSCGVITNRNITYRVNPGSSSTGGPTGTLTTDLIINNFSDGNNGPGNPYQLQVQNNTATPFSYEIWIENVPYATIPGLNLGNHTLNTINNGDGTYSYLYTSTVALGAFQNTIISGSGGAPTPLGSGAACGCVSFYKL